MDYLGHAMQDNLDRLRELNHELRELIDELDRDELSAELIDSDQLPAAAPNLLLALAAVDELEVIAQLQLPGGTRAVQLADRLREALRGSFLGSDRHG